MMNEAIGGNVKQESDKLPTRPRHVASTLIGFSMYNLPDGNLPRSCYQGDAIRANHTPLPTQFQNREKQTFLKTLHKTRVENDFMSCFSRCKHNKTVSDKSFQRVESHLALAN